MTKAKTCYYDSPIGPLVIRLALKSGALLSLDFAEKGHAADDRQACPAHLLEELDAYFSGALRKFNFPCQCAGTPFQEQVWLELANIPYGTTYAYGDIARRLKKPTAVRAVARAIAANPLPIIIPCHRIIGADGSLTGYSGGTWRKKWLLEHEKNQKP